MLKIKTELLISGANDEPLRYEEKQHPLENIWRVHWYFCHNLLKLLSKFSSDKFSYKTILYSLTQLPASKKIADSGITDAKLMGIY